VVDGVLVGGDGLSHRPLRLVEHPEVVRGEEVVLVQLHRQLVLVARLVGKPARREQVAEIVVQVGVVGIRRQALLLLENPVVERVPGGEVLPVEGFLFLPVLLVGAEGKSRGEEQRGGQGFFHVSGLLRTSAGPPGGLGRRVPRSRTRSLGLRNAASTSLSRGPGAGRTGRSRGPGCPRRGRAWPACNARRVPSPQKAPPPGQSCRPPLVRRPTPRRWSGRGPPVRAPRRRYG